MKTSELKQHISIREGVTSDEYVCGQVVGEYKHLPIKDRIVMDAGSNIGAFTTYAILEGAKQVIAFEPEDSNYKQWELNCLKYNNAIGHKGALTMSNDGHVSFYLTNGKAKDGYSVVSFKGRTEVEVTNYNFHEQLEKYRPSVIKMDIEGAEFELLSEPLPEYVTDIIVEIHFSKRAFREQLPDIENIFSDWKCIIKPKNTGKNFHTLAQYTRHEL